MTADVHGVLDEVIRVAATLRRILKKLKTPQVRSTDECGVVKATSLAWFNSHRPILLKHLGHEPLIPIDDDFKRMLVGADRATARSTYDRILSDLKVHLTQLRSTALLPHSPIAATTDAPPPFGSLVADPAMQAILVRRWQECVKCVGAEAALAATVMMGGLLEALLLARVHREPDKKKVFQSNGAPKDHQSKKPLPLQDWALRNYIDVAHELGWITASAKDLGEVVRDYRNYVHPHKEMAHGVALGNHDAQLFWEVSKGITRQLLAIVGA